MTNVKFESAQDHMQKAMVVGELAAKAIQPTINTEAVVTSPKDVPVNPEAISNPNGVEAHMEKWRAVAK